jgi:teichoic acid transport system ATP-binding protein
MSDDIAIKVENLTKIYKLYDSPLDRLKEALHPLRRQYHKDFYALNDVSFEIKKGETVGIIGRNGSGKSTLLKLITGVLTPSSGSVTVNGKVSALLELGAGFNPELTGIENVYFNGTLMGYTREEMDAKLDDILAFADIGEFVHQPVKMYSSGMFVRLAFSTAINVEPNVLIVDEALAVGDIYFQQKCYRKLDEMKNNGATVLFVTHSNNAITKYCDNALLLEEGISIGIGEPKNICDRYHEICTSDKQDKPALTGTPANQKQRYGNMKAKITNTEIIDHNGTYTTNLITSKSFAIKLYVEHEEQMQAATASYVIKDKLGNVLCGTNTDFLAIEHPPVNAGDCIVYEFNQILRLLPGEYFLTVGVQGIVAGKMISYDIQPDHIILKVDGKLGHGFFDMDSNVTVRSIEG